MCEYHFHDIVLIMSMAACHMKRVESVCTLKSMDASELTNIIVLQCFVAHSYVMDEVLGFDLSLPDSNSKGLVRAYADELDAQIW